VRIRNALVATALLVVTMFGFASPASASESIGSCIIEVADELHTQIAGGMSESEAYAQAEDAAEECIEAPNPVLPDPAELIWVTIAFLVLLGVGIKFAFPLITKAMQARSDRIREDLEAAERTRLDAEAAAADYRASLGDAEAESARIMDEARAAAEAYRSSQKAAADAEAADIRAKANADAESIKSQALSDLRADVVQLAVGAAEQVVQHNLDAAAQSELIENYINQVGSAN